MNKMFKKWCEVTSCNGIIDLYEAKNAKCKFWFWIMVMVSMTVCSVWFTFRTIQLYIETPFVTNVGTVIGANLLLPDSLICYNGGLNVGAMKSQNLSDPFIQDLVYAMSLSWTESAKTMNSSRHEFEKFLTDNQISVKMFFDNFSYRCSDFVEMFYSHGNWNISCNTSLKIFNSKGKCHLFTNPGVQSYPTMDDGLQLTLKQPSNSFVEAYPEQAVQLGTFSGFSISLEKGFGFQQSGRSLLIPLNVKAEIILNPKRYIRFEANNRCDSSEMIYHSNTCYYKCYVQEIIRVCNCSTIDFWDDSSNVSHEMCNPFKFFTDSGDLNVEIIGACQAKCKPICDEWIYETTVTYTFIDPSILPEPKSFLSIAYNTMQYTKIEEVKAFTVDMAIANVGGQSGLWLGASIVTIIQAIYYFVLSVYQRFFNK